MCFNSTSEEEDNRPLFFFYFIKQALLIPDTAQGNN